MRDRLDELGDATVAVITFAAQRKLAGYRHRFAEPLTVLADEDRAVYDAYGLERGSAWTVWGLGVLRRYAQLLRRGRRLERPGDEDVRQLGGDFVVGPDGRLALCRPQESPDDRPDVDELVDAVRAARAS